MALYKIEELKEAPINDAVGYVIETGARVALHDIQVPGDAADGEILLRAGRQRFLSHGTEANAERKADR